MIGLWMNQLGEQNSFCLVDGETILGQVACQLDGKDLWVGWSMAPKFFAVKAMVAIS